MSSRSHPQRVGGKQIGGMALHIQRLKPAKAPA
jgi:hypothetical protein